MGSPVYRSEVTGPENWSGGILCLTLGEGGRAYDLLCTFEKKHSAPVGRTGGWIVSS